MVLTRRQVDRVVNVQGYSFIEPGQVPNLSARYAESYIRRRLFALEDQAIIDLYAMYKAAFKRIRERGATLAFQYGVNALANDGVSMKWRAGVLEYAEAEIRALHEAAARQAYDRAVLGYLVSHYGRAWGLAIGLNEDAPELKIANIQPLDASKNVFTKMMEVDDLGDAIIYGVIRDEWGEPYVSQADELIPRVRRALNAAMAAGEDNTKAMMRVANVMGVQIGDQTAAMRANFGRVETLTRSYILNAQNTAALELYQANGHIATQVEFVPANDNRVCPTCEKLRGRRWPTMSPEIIRPVADTHYNCRCTLVPIVPDDWRVPDTYLPRQGFEDWLGASLSAGWLLDRLTARRTIDSSRIGNDEDYENATID